MKKPMGLIRILVLVLMLVLLFATYMLSKSRVEQTALNLPVKTVSTDLQLPKTSLSELETYQAKREQTRQEDIQTLQRLLDGNAGTTAFLADVSAQLSAIVSAREAELAIEGALLGGGFSPCLAVVTPTSVTVIVSRESLTRGEAALIMTLCESHTNQSLENIKIMTGDMI